MILRFPKSVLCLPPPGCCLRTALLSVNPKSRRAPEAEPAKIRTEDEGMNSDEQNLGLGSWSRRRFVQMGAASAVVLGAMNSAHAYADEATTSGTMINVPFDKRTPRTAFMGPGGPGTDLLENLLAADGQVVALCDLVRDHAEHAASLVVKAGQAKPQIFSDDPY